MRDFLFYFCFYYGVDVFERVKLPGGEKKEQTL